MGKHDGSRHELVRLVTGIPEHNPLIARALFVRLLAFGRSGIDALTNVA